MLAAILTFFSVITGMKYQLKASKPGLYRIMQVCNEIQPHNKPADTAKDISLINLVQIPNLTCLKHFNLCLNEI